MLVLVPLVWPLVARMVWRTRITWGEMGLNMGAGVALVGMVYSLGMMHEMSSTEVLNGEVTGKEKLRVSCEHSYPCNCTTHCSGTGSSRSCYTTCQTCHLHSYDISWRVYTNLENFDFDVDRLSSQGLEEPPRWTKVEKGQPVAMTHRYTWYVKAAKNTLFNTQGGVVEKFASLLPEYPKRVYDYHYLDRVLAVGVKVPDLKDWNEQLALALRELGPKRQANVVVVLANTADQLYLEALRAKWLGGEKNDVVVVLGTPEYPAIAWAGVITWSDSELFKVKLRDDLASLREARVDEVIPVIKADVLAGFKRKENRDFEYLKKDVKPPVWVLALAGLLGVGSSVGLSVVFHKNDWR